MFYRATSLNCVNTNNVNMCKHNTAKYIRTAGYTQLNNLWTLDKLIASLSICLLVFILWIAILLAFVKLLCNVLQSSVLHICRPLYSCHSRPLIIDHSIIELTSLSSDKCVNVSRGCLGYPVDPQNNITSETHT